MATSNYDRSEKFERYRSLDAFAEYVLLAGPGPPPLRALRAAPDGSWLLTEASHLDATVPLTAIGCELALAEVYAEVTFGPRPI